MDQVYMMVALYRKKDNPGSSQQVCFREIAEPTSTGMEEARIRLKKRMVGMHGVWRIYRSVNLRDLRKAKKKLMVEMIIDDNLVHIGSKWKSVMMEPSCKVGRGKFLIDVDKGDRPESIEQLDDMVSTYFMLHNIKPLEYNRTLNGVHYVCDPFDTRDLVKTFGGAVEIKKDALFFIESLTI